MPNDSGGEDPARADRQPRPAARGLARQRLLAPLIDPDGPSLVLVLAPPGAGKTTLLGQAATAMTAGPVAWLRLTGDDGREDAFVAHLTRVLTHSLGLALDPPAALDSLVRALERRVGPALVVLDDLHEIVGSPAEAALERFLADCPARVRVLMGSRRPPGLNVPRLLASGTIAEISSDDLRFRCWEVEDLFVSVHGEPLSPETAAALTRRTGGWAAGLQLFHLATTGKSAAARQQAVTDLGARSRLIRSYLAKNVLAELPEPRRRFLLFTCTLGRLTGPLCDALLDTTGSGAVLEELERQQLFTASVDDGWTFRYHEVLQTHLELGLVAEFGQEQARGWYSRSAELLEADGALRDALRAYARAEDWGSVARLIQRSEQDITSAVSSGRDSLLPSRLLEHDPWLALAEARRRLRRGDLEGAITGFKLAENLLDEPEFRQRCQADRAIATVWSVGGAGFGRDGGTAFARAGDAGERSGSDRLRAAVRRASPPSASVGRSGHDEQDLASGLEALLRGDVELAGQLLKFVAVSREASSFVRLAARLGIVVAELAAGHCRAPVDQLEEIALAAEVDGQPWLERLARGIMAAVLATVGSPQWRWDACTDLLIECQRDGDDWGAALLQLTAAIAAEAVGDPQAAARFEDAGRRFHDLDAPVLQTWSRALAIRRAAAEANRSGRAATDLLDAARTLEATARGLRLWGAQGLANVALALIGPRSDAATHWEWAGELARTCGLPETVVLRTPVVAPATVAAPRMSLTCFGGFRVQVGEREVDLSALRPRARTLLRLLALEHHRDSHRESLVETLWPGADLAAGTRRLQVAISSIRQALADAGVPEGCSVRRQGDTYRLMLPEDCEVDLDRFQLSLRRGAAAAAQGDLEAAASARQEALGAYTGDLLPEDGPAEHIQPERERLRLLAAEVADDLARDRHRLGQLDAALGAARRSLAHDPYRDRTWDLLAELHELQGDPSAASRVRSEHHRVLAELDAPLIFG